VPTHARARAFLESVAKGRTLITYQELANALQISPPYSIHRVTEALERLMEEDAAADRPFIAALAISKTRGGLPGPGFFDCARRLGRFAGDPDGQDARTFLPSGAIRRSIFSAQSSSKNGRLAETKSLHESGASPKAFEAVAETSSVSSPKRYPASSSNASPPWWTSASAKAFRSFEFPSPAQFAGLASRCGRIRPLPVMSLEPCHRVRFL